MCNIGKNTNLKHFEKSKINFITANEVNKSYYGDYAEYYRRECEDAVGEINLWRAVLLQALINLKTKSKKRRMQPAKKEAYEWFTKKENAEEVMIICECAEVSYGKVMNAVNDIVKSQKLNEVFC